MRENERTFVDIHVLQTVPPSCINRDDTGSPKTAVYGGVTRARVSSQCWKHEQREMLRDMFGPEHIGVRTKKIVDMISEEIQILDKNADAKKLSKEILIAAGLNPKEKEEEGTGALFFISHAQAKALAKLAVEKTEASSKKAKDTIKSAIMDSPGIDMALFGRMVATKEDLNYNYDACAQVAHSISTHAVIGEFDYFTAIDDRTRGSNAGAGHISTTEFNSSTLYRYATISVHNLHKLLKDNTVKACRGFVESFVLSMPTGRQNTFANRTLPDTVLVCIRSDQPVNLVGAFEKPVPAGKNGYVDESVKRLVEHAARAYREYVDVPRLSLAVGDGLHSIAKVVPFKTLLDELTAYLDENAKSGDKS